ncbi:phosphoribosyltransferase family protein [Tengunoibacter tsumagoiensis]|uniref:Orotate phosphoribosyltransferase n=1 Tax=Tengunoibacter tsumagoiensis TaxID=2014871 RepID=A0A402A0F9_9CHLR|nr:phosphoribosyltransferase family protein [Tengunoibacter tsumagoiensis]GCE12637.1 orotate phosphoribosyltransferase [Tengunoibacter tsumagoiensis]
MNDPRIMQKFADVNAIVTESHFVYTSGRHSSVYVNKDALYVHPGVISALCQEMARPYEAEQIDVVVGPVLGGIVLSQWVAHHLNARRTSGETLAVFAEKGSDGVDKHFIFTRGYDAYLPGKNILIVEDILTTGGSAKQAIEAVRQQGGNVVGLTVLCNRGNVQPADVGNVPLHALIELPLQTYTEEECPFCAQGVPINTRLGKGKAFLARQKAAIQP